MVKIMVSSYNRAHYLRQCIESLLEQTYTKYHIIIVDDCSTDGSADMARGYAEAYPKKITAICKERNLGVCDSVNRALPFCEEREFLCLTADDDIWFPDKLARQIECFLRDRKVGLVCCDTNIIDAEGKPTSQKFSDMHGKFEDYSDNVPRNLFLRGNFICGSSVMLTHDAVASFGFHIPSRVGVTTDFYMWLAVSSAYDCNYIKEPLMSYRSSSGAVSNKYRRQMDREAYYLRHEAYRRFPGLRKAVSAAEARGLLLRMAYRNARNSISARDYSQYIWFVREALRLQPSVKTLVDFSALFVKGR